MERSRLNAETNIPPALRAISIDCFDRLVLPIFVIDKELSLRWQNQASRQAWSSNQLNQIISQPAIADGLRGVFLGKPCTGFTDQNSGKCLRAIDLVAQDFLLCGIEDCTAQERLAEEYRRLQKNGAVEMISQGLGGDLKDRLTGVVGNLSLARVMLEEGRGPQESLERIRDAERAALEADSLVQQFMLFYHNDVETAQNLDLVFLLNNAASLTLAGGSRTMQISLREPIWKLTGNPGQIQQVFQNLLQNATEAMAGAGVIHVDLENLRVVASDEAVAQTSAKPRDSQLSPGDYVAVHIRDSGEGILSRDLPHVFDPFFSRKDGRQGLGLTVALSIIRKHGGCIDLYSQSGKGTTVSLYLPINCAAEPLAREERPHTPAKILVMDDESLVREVWERMLPRLGHRGSYVAEGAEALYLYQTALNSDYPFDLVILDLSVPSGLGALNTLERLREIDPQVKAVICSGHTQDPIMQDFAACGFRAALPKPFSLDVISRLIQDVLG